MTVGYGMIEFCMANNYSIFAASKGVKLFLLRPNNSGGNRLATSGVCCKTADAMRILALDHGTKRIGVAVSDETKTIAQPLEYIPAEPFGDFLERLRKLLLEKEIDLILIGMPRNMDGSYGPAAQKVEVFVGVLKTAVTVPIKLWDERLTSTMANRVMIQGNVRRDKRKDKVDAMAAAILLQSYLDVGSNF
jgi:putative Holliday junction resolvase